MKKREIIDTMAVPFMIILAKAMTFLFDIVLSSFYGANNITDAFIMANSLPTILFDGIANAIIVCYIPVYHELLSAGNDVGRYSNNCATVSTIFGFLIAVVFSAFSDAILRIYARGFNAESFLLLSYFSKIIIWGIPFIGAYSVFRAYLQAEGFKALSTLPQIITYFILILLVLMYKDDYRVLGFATVLGNLVSFVILLFICMKRKWRFKVLIDFRDKNLRKLIFLIFPILLSSVLSEINAFVDKYFSSFYDSGIVSNMNYGYKLSFSIQGVIASSVMIIVYPSLCKYAAERNIKGIREKSILAIKIISYIIFPIVAGCICCSKEIIQCVYGHGKFDYSNVLILAKIFKVYLLGVIPMCVMLIGDKICYAIEKTKYTFITSIFTVSLNIVLNIYLSRMFGYIGLVYSTVISIMFGCLLVFFLLKKYNREIIKSNFFMALMKPILPTIIMVGAILLFKYYVDCSMMESSFLYVLIEIFIGIISYFLGIILVCKNDVIPYIYELKGSRRSSN